MKETYDTDQFREKIALVLELVRPKPELGVHQLDIITMRTPDDDVKVISVLLWADCTTDSSHSTRAGYTIDLETERVVASTGWYSPFFATMKTPLIGTKYEGVKKACESAVAAHKNIEYKWLTAIGWDCMIMKDDEVRWLLPDLGLFLLWTCLDIALMSIPRARWLGWGGLLDAARTVSGRRLLNWFRCCGSMFRLQVVFFEGNFAGARTPRRMFLSFTNLKGFLTQLFWPFGKGNSVTPGAQDFK